MITVERMVYWMIAEFMQGGRSLSVFTNPFAGGMAVAYIDRVVACLANSSLGAPYGDEATTLGLRLGSANLPGTADERVRYVVAQYRCGIFVVRVVQ
jgi:hypothetical protein